MQSKKTLNSTEITTFRFSSIKPKTIMSDMYISIKIDKHQNGYMKVKIRISNDDLDILNAHYFEVNQSYHYADSLIESPIRDIIYQLEKHDEFTIFKAISSILCSSNKQKQKYRDSVTNFHGALLLALGVTSDDDKKGIGD